MWEDLPRPVVQTEVWSGRKRKPHHDLKLVLLFVPAYSSHNS